MRSSLASAKKQQLKYPPCSEHKKELANIICFDAQCKSQGLICTLCKNSNHIKHQTQPLKMFLKMFDDFHDTITGDSTNKVLNELNAMHQNVLVTLRQVIQKLSNNIREFQIELVKGFKQMTSNIINEADNKKQIFYLVQNIRRNKTDNVYQDISKLMSNLSYDPAKKKLQMASLGKKYLTEYAQKQFNYIEIIKQLQFNAMTIISTAKKQTKQMKSMGPIYKFSEALKPSIIKLTENNMVARQTQSSNADLRFALVQPCLPLDKVSEITYNIKNRANWIGLGISLKSIIVAKKFKFTYSTIGHGSFLLSTNGYTWSHSRSEDNIKLKAFTFDTGANVKVAFDPINNKVIYTNLESEKTYQQPIDLTQVQKSGGINFCSNLCHCGDEIKIVNFKKL